MINTGSRDASARGPGNDAGPDDEAIVSLLDTLLHLVSRWKLIVGGALLAGMVAAGVSMLLPPVYVARTTLLPPQQAQSLSGLAPGALSALGALAGSAAGLKTPTDQFVGLLQSETIADRLIDAFSLMEVYGAKFREDARRGLAMRTQISVGRRDGLIVIQAEDSDAKRAADLTNRYVVELRRLSNELTLTEAQQRRRFFETQLESTRGQLAQAQQTLQASGFSQGALRAEPRAAAEGYARLRAEADAAELRLRALRTNLTGNAPEVQQQLELLAGLRDRISRAEKTSQDGGSSTYLTVYREFKYHEMLFELFSRQYELARVDEAREGAMVQVVDAAQPPERRARPKRAQIVLTTTAAAAVFIILVVLVRQAWRRALYLRIPPASPRSSASS